MDDLFSMAQMQSDMMQQQNMMMQQEMMLQQDMMMQSPYQQQMMQNQYYQQNMMYQQPIPNIDRYGMVKYSKQQYLDILRNYIISNCGFQIAISREQPIDELPDNLRHCCVESKTKITMLPKLVCYIPETNMQIMFYFCRDCGKLFYYKDFMI